MPQANLLHDSFSAAPILRMLPHDDAVLHLQGTALRHWHAIRCVLTNSGTASTATTAAQVCHQCDVYARQPLLAFRNRQVWLQRLDFNPLLLR